MPWYSCEISRKSNFLKKDKIVISVKIRNFFRSRMTKRTSSSYNVEFRRIPKQSNFVEFRDSRNFTFFEAQGVGCCKTACKRYVI